MATKPMQNIQQKPYIRVCDLFACSGGLSHGLNEVEGIEVVVANEYDKNCWATFKHNHPNCNLIEGDITDSNIKDQIVQACIDSKVNVIVGGIPCVAFSIAGKRDIFDDRGQLYLDYFEIVERVKPKICLIENVKGLDSMKHLDITNISKEVKENMKTDMENKMKKSQFETKYNQKFFFVKEEWKKRFENLGYICEYKILKASNYGVPQHRERIIFIASKINDKIIWPKETHNEKGDDKKKKWVTVKEAIDDLKTREEDKDFSHEFREYKDADTIQKMQIQQIETSYSGYGESNYKCHPDKPSNTVKENHGAVFVHYDLPRHMTARELARLQSFPDNFIFKCRKGQAYKHIGNAVPPLLGKHLGLSIKEMFEKKNVEYITKKIENITLHPPENDLVIRDNDDENFLDNLSDISDEEYYNISDSDDEIEDENKIICKSILDNIILQIELNKMLKEKNIRIIKKSFSQFQNTIKYVLHVDLTKPFRIQDIVNFNEKLRSDKGLKIHSDRKRNIVPFFNETTNGYWDELKIKGEKYLKFNPKLAKSIVKRAKLTPGTFFTEEVKKQVLERANYRCEMCFNSFTEVESNIDHWIPRSQGGNGTLENGVALCQQCNNMKKGKTPEQFFKTYQNRFEKINKRINN